ncbi:hypothetical protein EVAR_14687_1 [Eumeta japonica]|uniref:Uncharacterized protein n=1 Tax=Eumeta variegata TaxID=151549 RepID=A0A4C1U2F5_EUMVA|nr:hypothetical protein EVAR_14687_1 [Eumeta japonica]
MSISSRTWQKIADEKYGGGKVAIKMVLIVFLASGTLTEISGSPTIRDVVVGCGLEANVDVGVPQTRGDNRTLRVVRFASYKRINDDPARRTVVLC